MFVPRATSFFYSLRKMNRTRCESIASNFSYLIHIHKNVPIHHASVDGVMVSIVAFQAIDPGSTPGQGTFFISLFFISIIWFFFFTIKMYGTLWRSEFNWKNETVNPHRRNCLELGGGPFWGLSMNLGRFFCLPVSNMGLFGLKNSKM